MATGAGQLHSYSATQPQKRTVSDRIILADVMENATLNALGLNNESKFSFVNTPGKIYEWLEDTYAPVTDTGVSGLTASSTTTTFVGTAGTVYNLGDVIKIDDEYMWVSGISGTTITVTRNYGGTQATHSDTSTITIVGSNRLEGASANDSPWTEPTTGYNYSTILQRTIEISRTDARINQYGIPGVVDREIDKKIDELLMKLNKQFFHGQRKAGSSTAPRSSGGFQTFVTTNKNALSSTPALTQKHIEDEMQDCWDAGGRPKLLICGGWAKRKIADFYSASVRTERAEQLGGVTIERIMMPLGVELSVLVDRHCQTNTLYIVDTDHVGFITLDDFFYEDLGKTKDTAAYGQVVGEYGLVAAFEKAHSYISGFSTSS